MGQHQNEDEGRVQKIKIKTYYGMKEEPVVGI